MNAPRATEQQCQSTIVQAARLAGWMVHAERPAQRGNGRWMTALQGDPGFPDLVLVRGETLLFCELKRRPNKVEPAQQKWLDALEAAWGEVEVCWVPEEMDWLLSMLVQR